MLKLPFNFRWCQHALVLFTLFIVASAQAQHLAVSKVSNVIKSDNDNREYRYLTLSNNLRVLLISDPAAEKSAAALNIHVGSHQNPKERPGLAHFLEHMLFLGTEKYPAADEYQEFISQHGGSNNAYTAAENTNYFFDVEHASLEPALDRFAQFFISPLFDASYIEHEKNAVNAEYLSKISDDERREWDVYRSIFNPEHPAAIFDVGSLGTLADMDGHSVRDDLLAFYQNYYSANLMTLVVLGNRKLDDLQKIVEPRFVQVPNKNRSITQKYPNLFMPKSLPARASLKPLKELRQLTLAFPVPNYADKYKTKPLNYLGHFLGNESSGSLLALLKSLGWAESLSAGELYRSRQDALFAVTIQLTKEGATAKDQIVSAVFDYLKIMSARGISEWRFVEMQQIAEINFRFRDKPAAIDSVMELSQAMHDYPAQDVLWGDYAYTKFDEELLRQALGYLRKDNVFISLVAPEASTAISSSFYNTAYSAAQGIPEVLELKPMYHQKLGLPERNIFIPKNLVLKAPSMLPASDGQAGKNVPALLVNNEDLKLWFLQDRKFRSPKAELNFRFKLPVLNNSLENTARTQLFAALITDQLNEYAYPASLAGLTFSVKANSRGLEVNVAGYTDKQSLLMNKILAAIGQASFTEARFETLKDDLIREWRNEDKNLPYAVLAKKVPRLQYLPYWGSKEFIDVLYKTSYDQFKQFSSELLRGAKLETLLYGNLYPQDAIKLSAIIEHQLLKKRSKRLPQLAKVLRSENKDNKSWLYIYPLEHNDHAVELYVQALAPYIDDAAHMKLLTQILEPRFFNQLRTEKQLGYVVSVFPMPIRNVEGSFFVVQSPNVCATALVDEVNNFLSANAASLTEGFAENKAALLSELREPALSLNEQSEKFWQSILLNDYEFTRQQDLINAVSKITPESLRKYYEAAFLQKNRRLWLSTEKLDNMKDFDVIQNVAAYQQKQQGYLQQ
ncbi:peptidase M16 [Cellvibrio zantedeschiae]|uniref:Protease 3 n=1 Tax=Cellvibrio zantedeschiae TaxID=1237077 RepID=A0ABQ3ASL5_9GAMM|nr:insulinase family protein [Cellvibrio zantedeschiae]GGY66057.1 peptidase M16 [Cellvibrio zantedeschiae]